MAQYITTHSPSGTATFSTLVPPTQHPLNPAPGFSMRILSTTHTFPADLSTDDDIRTYSTDRTSGFPHGTICPPGGAATAIVSLAPGTKSPMHRTLTMDTNVVLSGEVELRLDSGETRVMRTGDCVVMRGTMHQWVNTGTEEARMVGTALAISTPLVVGGQEVGQEYLF